MTDLLAFVKAMRPLCVSVSRRHGFFLTRRPSAPGPLLWSTTAPIPRSSLSTHRTMSSVLRVETGMSSAPVWLKIEQPRTSPTPDGLAARRCARRHRSHRRPDLSRFHGWWRL